MGWQGDHEGRPIGVKLRKRKDELKADGKWGDKESLLMRR